MPRALLPSVFLSSAGTRIFTLAFGFAMSSAIFTETHSVRQLAVRQYHTYTEQMDDSLVPLDVEVMTRFGKNDPKKLKSYLSMLAAFLGGKPPNTRTTYACGIKQFFGLFDWICPEDVTAAHAVAFKRFLLEHKGVSESTTYYRLSALTSFFDFLMEPPDATSAPLLSANPFRRVSRSDIKPTPYARATAMDWTVFKKIVDAIPADATGLRDKAYVRASRHLLRCYPSVLDCLRPIEQPQARIRRVRSLRR